MIGNDIVDLLDADAQATERTPAFDARVFTRGERARILAAGDSVRARWLMWAAKEAAYNLARKRDGDLCFSPRRFEVGAWAVVDAPGRPGTRLEGRVHTEELSLDCEWISAPGFVHALCRLPGTPPPQCIAVERISALEDPGEAVRRLAVGEIARTLAAAEDAFRIEKRGRIPFLWFEDREAAADLSLSHHGSWVAFACRLYSGSEPTEFSAQTTAVAAGPRTHLVDGVRI